jgi:DtxR family Mn-dependent transcriptional regulator
MLSQTEENYLKSIYKLSADSSNEVSTNSISAEINTTAASVTDMLKKLSDKKLLHYKPYRGVRLTPEGEIKAKELIRRHRLWEVFLVTVLGMNWDEVHDIAEQMEHITSPLLIEKLDSFLGKPQFDPHGDPIPDINGNYSNRSQILLSDLTQGTKAVIVGVKEHTADFLRFLTHAGLIPGTELKIESREPYDGSLSLLLNGNRITVSEKVSSQIFVSSQV